MILLVVLALAAGQSEPPTQTGDRIGTATMLSDRSIRYKLRSVECDGTIAEGEFVVRPKEMRYKSMLAELGAIKPGESKVVLAAPTTPCPVR